MTEGIIGMMVVALIAAAGSASGDTSSRWARYELLSTVEHKAPPVSEVVLSIGPREKLGAKQYQWREVAGNKPSGERYAIRLLSESVPMVGDKAPGTIKRYVLREGDGQPVEYLDARTKGPLLPKFGFVADLLPQTEAFLTARKDGFAVTGSYLGHVIALVNTGAGRWSAWPAPLVIELNPDEVQYVYGLARDTEGHYLKKGDYTYLPLTHEEVDQLIDLGVNSFSVDDQTEDWAYRRPVFYYKQFGPETKLKYPELLYRSNFRGAVAFIDEPEIHILTDRSDLDSLTHPEQGGYLLSKRLEEIWNRPAPGEWRRGLLREQLRAKGVNLGALALDDTDHPIWVTMPETAFYQLQGGASGVVHEGRYRLDKYTSYCERFLGSGVELTAREMLLMDYAFLRGAARAFGKSWGMSIYGQTDPAIAPEAINLAYDMGARYIWFWTFDHQHHLPHFMKIELLKQLREHKAHHPRGSLAKLLNAARTAIVFPYGYAYFLEFENLWDAKNLQVSFTDDAGVPYREVIAAALAEGIACAKSGEDFDFVMDIGQDFKGYTRIVKVGVDGRVTDSKPAPRPAKLPPLQIETSRSEPSGQKPTLEVLYGPNHSNWADGQWVSLGSKEQVVSFLPQGSKDVPWAGLKDLSARVSFARDERFLYLVAQVTDDKHCQDNAGGEMWRGDSLELAMDLMFDRPDAPLGYAEFLVGSTPEGPQVFAVRNAEGSGGGPVRDARVSIKPGSDGDMTYEVAIPWKAVTAAPPEILDSCAVRFRVNDNDGSGRKCALEFGSGEKLPGVRDGFAVCSLAPIPGGKGNVAFVRQMRQMKRPDRRWELAVNASASGGGKAALEVVLERGGRTAASGSFALELPAGRSRSHVIVNGKSVSPGAYRCRARLRSAAGVLSETSFPVYVVK